MKLLTIEQLADRLKRSVTHVRNCVCNAHLRHLVPPPLPREGNERRRYWDTDAVEAWISKNLIGDCSEDHADITLFTSERAAAFLDTTEHVLRTSRSTGVLWGAAAPQFIKRGSAVRYRLQDLKQFVESLPRFSSTAEVHAAIRMEAAQ